MSGFGGSRGHGHPVREARARGDALADRFQGHELDALLVRAIPEGRFVRHREAFRNLRQLGRIERRHRNLQGQGGILPDIAQIGRTRHPPRLGGVAVACDQPVRLLLQCRQKGIAFFQVEGVEGLIEGTDALMLDIGEQQAERAEQPGGGRHENPVAPKRLRQIADMDAAIAAERHERKSRRIEATLRRHRAQGAHHPGVRDQMNAVGGHRRVLSQPSGDGAERRLRFFPVQSQLAADQGAWIDIAQMQVRVGYRRLRPALVVTDRARHRAGAVRADLNATAGIDPGDAAAARADFGDIDGRRLDQIARSLGHAVTESRVPADLGLRRHRKTAVGDDRGLGRGTAHVKHDAVAEAELPAKAMGADDAGGWPGFDHEDRLLRRHPRRQHAAVRLHDVERHADPDVPQPCLQTVDIALDHGPDIGVHDGRAGTLVFLNLRHQFAR